MTPMGGLKPRARFLLILVALALVILAVRYLGISASWVHTSQTQITYRHATKSSRDFEWFLPEIHLGDAISEVEAKISDSGRSYTKKVRSDSTMLVAKGPPLALVSAENASPIFFEFAEGVLIHTFTAVASSNHRNSNLFFELKDQLEAKFGQEPLHFNDGSHIWVLADGVYVEIRNCPLKSGDGICISASTEK
ncbi:MAG: hypothetical protein ACREJQ_03045 [bacterium]